MTNNFRLRLLASTVLLDAALLATPAIAQDAQDAPAETADATTDAETIVVTGSLITNPNLERSTPVNVTTSEEVELRQTNVAEQLLREIPGVTPSIGSNVNNGNNGVSLVNLRGLGSNRNLVLIDGVRLTPAGIVGRFDLNNVPLALVERTEVLTGGASTTYGADAVSGVVNFITKRDFTGLELAASEQITERGDGNIFRVDATIGASFDDQRGNAVLSLGYQEADALYQSAREFGRFSITSATGLIGGSGLSPSPSRLTGVNPLGLDSITDGCGAAGQPACNNVQGLRSVTNDGAAFAPTGAFTPYNFAPLNVYQTPFERFNMYGAANYEVADGLEVYARGLFSKNTVTVLAAPSGVFGLDVDIPLNNPFLSAAQRNAFCAFDTNPGVGYTPRFTQAECAAAATATGPDDPNYRQVTSNLGRRATEFGPRIQDFKTTYFDFRAGVRGQISSTLNFDIFGSYGEGENTLSQAGYYLNSRTRQSILAGPNGCFDSSNGCIPVNFFGADGSITPEQSAFLTATSYAFVFNSQAQARATISGDFGASLPWAEDVISFALGGEYRRYVTRQTSDSLSQSGDLGGAGGSISDVEGGFDVYEAFGELIAPIVQERPFFHSLTLEAGARYSAYTISAPGTPSFNTFTWKAGGSWEPIRDMKIRGNFARAVRSPNIAELFSPLNTGLTNLADDPCASREEDGSQIPGRPTPTGTLRAICLAQGAPASQLGQIQQPASGQANTTSGGNLNLRPEKSNSWTVGVVIQPAFLPGFSASIDYYNIKVTDAITLPTPDDVIAACFGPNPQSPAAGAETTEACTAIRRNGSTGALAGDPAATPGLFQELSNLGRIKTDGVDATMNYNTDLGFAKLALSFAGNWTRSAKFKATPSSINRECVGYYSANCGSPGGTGSDIGGIQPEFSWTQRTTLSFDNIDLSLLWRHISAVRYEPGLAPLYSGPVPAGQSPLPGSPPPGGLGDRNFNFIEAADYFDLAVRVGVGDNLTLTATVANLLDKQPPIVGANAGSTPQNNGNTFPSTYDALGRSFRVGARLRF